MPGPAVPVAALRHAARHLRPSAVVVWAQRRITAEPDSLRGLAPHTGAILAAGPGWQHADLPAAVTKVNSLRVALDLLDPAPPLARGGT